VVVPPGKGWRTAAKQLQFGGLVVQASRLPAKIQASRLPAEMQARRLHHKGSLATNSI
jgi:hypothetical protein